MKQVAGTLRITLSNYRELAGFAQFGSDLDAETQEIIANGQRLTEILKQGQQVPMPVEKQIMIIYAATHGFLKEYPVNVLKRYEEEMHVFIETNHADILADIRNKKKLDDDLENRIKKALESFKGTFDPNKK